MSIFNDGGPAFPQPVQSTPGMTLRDYFASHAPKIPDEFHNAGRPIWPRYPAVETVGMTVEEMTAAWAQAAIEHGGLLETYYAELREWTLAREVVWRYEFADKMIANKDESI